MLTLKMHTQNAQSVQNDFFFLNNKRQRWRLMGHSTRRTAKYWMWNTDFNSDNNI